MEFFLGQRSTSFFCEGPESKYFRVEDQEAKWREGYYEILIWQETRQISTEFCIGEIHNIIIECGFFCNKGLLMRGTEVPFWGRSDISLNRSSEWMLLVIKINCRSWSLDAKLEILHISSLKTSSHWWVLSDTDISPSQSLVGRPLYNLLDPSLYHTSSMLALCRWITYSRWLGRITPVAGLNGFWNNVSFLCLCIEVQKMVLGL